MAVEREPVEQCAIDIGVRGRNGLQQILRTFHIHGHFRLAELQVDLQLDRDRCPNVDVLDADLEAGRAGRQVIVVERDVGECKIPKRVGSGAAIELRNRVLNLHHRALDRGAARIENRTANGPRTTTARLRITQDAATQPHGKPSQSNPRVSHHLCLLSAGELAEP